MDHKPDWLALRAMFNQPALGPATKPCDTSEATHVIYLGERMPKWLARDLMEERAANYEFREGMSREEAEALTLQGLHTSKP